jgi:ATP-citrate lyase beta-subunit
VLADIEDIKLNMPDFGQNKEAVEKFVNKLYRLYIAGGFAYLEINPFTFDKSEVAPLDLVAKVDDTSLFETSKLWGELEFPASFGSKSEPEEEYIKNLDEQTGASLKLTILNRKGRVWTMVAGGGASVIYADTVCDVGFSKELANYGEYSGDPSREFTYLYAKTILDLATKEKDKRGKVLLIGGGIANFTDVAKTFEGIIQALDEYKDKIKKNNIKIFVRRGGPNYKEGLENMRRAGEKMGLDIQVFGPETHITRIVSLALR